MARKRRRRNPRSVYLLCAVLGAQCLLYWVLTSKKLSRNGAPRDTTAAGTIGDVGPIRPAVIRTPRRPVYPYSVIRGGAYSLVELRAVLGSDPVAAAHYAVFDRSRVRLAAAPEPAAVYVSYRQNDRIYWTRHKVRMAAQEPLLTDGVYTARARCGNRISLARQEPSQAVEPPASELDMPGTPLPGDRDTSEAESSGGSMLVREIFPGLLGNSLPDYTAGGIADPLLYGFSGAGTAAGGAGGTAWGAAFPEPTGQAASPASTFPPAPPATGPAESHPPPPPVDPGIPREPTIPQPGGSGTGGGASLPPVTTVRPPPDSSGRPPGSSAGLGGAPGGTPGNAPPGGTPGGAPSGDPISNPGPGTGGAPFPPTSSGSPPQPVGGGEEPPVGLLQPDAPPPADIPEPATAALLLCGTVLIASRWCFRRPSKS